MIKIFTLLNLAGLFLFDLLFLSDVTVSQDVPATMAAGSEVKVVVTINKDQLSGFAKLQIDLPEGLSATAIETKGASFTFADGKAKFIWMALPSQAEFKVSYTLTAAATANGSLPITGKFSYIEENERKTKDLPTATVTITGGAVVVDNSAPANTTGTEPAANDLANAATAAPATEAAPVSAPAPVVSGTQGPGDVSVSRTITPVNANEMLVEVVVKKGALRGFGKLQELIPAGFTALEKNNADAIFTTQDRVVKFVWLNLPAQNELKVAYKLRDNGQPEGEYTVNGDFGYLLNDETQKAVVGTTTFYTGAKALEMIAAHNTEMNNNTGTGNVNTGNPPDNATAGTTNEAERAAALTELSELKAQYANMGTVDPGWDGRIASQMRKIDVLMADVKSGKVEPSAARRQAADLSKTRADYTAQIQQQKAAGNTNTNTTANANTGTGHSKPRTSPSGNVPAPETGVSYKVQISAAHREVGAAYFAERHHYSGDFSIERHEGWIKYTAGRFPAYSGARDQRNAFVSAGYNFPGPFVTAYNNGERITVQEALMISNQKWVQ